MWPHNADSPERSKRQKMGRKEKEKDMKEAEVTEVARQTAEVDLKEKGQEMCRRHHASMDGADIAARKAISGQNVEHG